MNQHRCFLCVSVKLVLFEESPYKYETSLGRSMYPLMKLYCPAYRAQGCFLTWV